MPKASDIIADLKADVCEADAQLVAAELVGPIARKANLHLVMDTLTRAKARMEEAQKVLERHLYGEDIALARLLREPNDHYAR